MQLRFSFDAQSFAVDDPSVVPNGRFEPGAEPPPAAPPAETSSPVGDDTPLFVRHRRARRYILRVLPDGRLRVTLPRWGSLREARAFVASSRRWIVSQRAKQRSAPPRPRDRRDPVIRPLVERWFREKAERELPALLMTLAREHQIPVARVSVRDQRSRWGACSSKGFITLNWRLIKVPAFVREYVLLHELMHRRELNHSRRFWRLVAACCPRHAEARAWLKREGKLLWPDGA